MSTEHTYTTAELNSSDNDELLRRLQANGYTAESVEDGPGASEVTARVAEDSVSSDDMKTALNTSFKQINSLYWNQGDGTFANVTTSAGPGLESRESTRGVASADLDRVGDLDVVLILISLRLIWAGVASLSA